MKRDKIPWWKSAWWAFQRFFDCWIYPAHGLRNMLFHRYDVVKLPQLKPWDYCDTRERMLYANMELIREFLEDEEPEKYVVWYKDENGVDAGHRYGECKGFPPLYPEYDGMYVMDIIKEIHAFWTKELPRLENERSILLDFNCSYVYGSAVHKKTEDGEFYTIEFDKSENPKTTSEIEGYPHWDVMDRYSDGDRENLLKDNFLSQKMRWLDEEIERLTMKYLHLSIEVRAYLWT